MNCITLFTDDWGSAMKRVPPQYRSSFFKQLYPVDDFVYEAVSLS